MTVYRSTVYSCRQTDITGVYHLKEKYLRFLRKCVSCCIDRIRMCQTPFRWGRKVMCD